MTKKNTGEAMLESVPQVPQPYYESGTQVEFSQTINNKITNQVISKAVPTSESNNFKCKHKNMMTKTKRGEVILESVPKVAQPYHQSGTEVQFHKRSVLN